VHPIPIYLGRMQRRDPKSFLEEVLSKAASEEGEIPEEMQKKLIALAEEKPGAKRASKIAAVLAEKTSA